MQPPTSALPQAAAADAVQALLAASCRRILAVPPAARAPHDLDTLAKLLGGLEAFKCLARPVCERLARTCTHVHVPPGAVLFEEDAPADCMYVVMAGEAHVHAQPLAEPPGAELAHCAGGGLQAAAAAEGAAAAGGQALLRSGRQRATADAVRLTPRQQTLGGMRRHTWEAGAYTTEERARLEGVLASIEQEQQQVGEKGEGQGVVHTSGGGEACVHSSRLTLH